MSPHGNFTSLLHCTLFDAIIISFSHMVRIKQTAKIIGGRGPRISLHHLQMKEQRATVARNAPCHSRVIRKKMLNKNSVGVLVL